MRVVKSETHAPPIYDKLGAGFDRITRQPDALGRAMTKKRTKKMILRFFCLALAGLLITSSPANSRPPNIVLLMADDLGYGELGCYGQQHIRTPHLDQLAADGIRFTQHYSGAPVCAPSRCVLMTGLHSGHAFIRDNREHKPEGQYPIPADTITLGERLQELGYATAAIGKWGLGYPGSEGDPNRQGFDLFYGYNCQRHAHNHFPKYLWRNDQRVILEGNARELSGAQFSQDKFTEEALRFVRDHRDQPFFLYLPFAIPHLSIQVPDESLEEYRGQLPEADYDHRDGYLKFPHPRAGYAAMITHLDRDIGKLLSLLDELELSDDTLVIFTSDNGPTYNRLGGSDSDFFASSGPLHGRKGSVYEGGLRVPLIARWPEKIKPGQTSDHLCAFWDYVPTLVEAAGGTAPQEIDGISFLPTLLGQGDQQEHDYLVWHFPSYGGQQAVRMGPWKGVRRNILRPSGPVFELYDLRVDIGENYDISSGNDHIVQQMMQILERSQTPSDVFRTLP